MEASMDSIAIAWIGFICTVIGFVAGALVGLLAGCETMRDKQQAVAYTILALVIGVVIAWGMWSYS